jgi:TonB-dependent receptor
MITRPDFSQLSPSLFLNPNPTNPLQNSGSAGNPALKPMRSNNFDVSIEKYFSKTTSVYAAGFIKEVDGFPTSISAPEVHDGATYQVSRPQNTNGAKIKGFEVGYQEFFDFLPGWLNGLGLQLNYTYVDSKTPSTIVGLQTPLQNLSRNSYNVVGIYEKNKFSFRVAYNWRDKYLTGIANIVGVGALPNFNKAYGWLDASASYDITKKVKVSLEGSNLLNTMRQTYWGGSSLPSASTLNDVQVMATLTLRL